MISEEYQRKELLSSLYLSIPRFNDHSRLEKYLDC